MLAGKAITESGNAVRLGPRGAGNVAALEDQPLSGWQDQAARCLIAGMSPDQTADRLVRMGLSRREAASVALELSGSPVLAPAREYWTRLQCREWYMATQANLGARRNR